MSFFDNESNNLTSNQKPNLVFGGGAELVIQFLIGCLIYCQKMTYYTVCDYLVFCNMDVLSFTICDA